MIETQTGQFAFPNINSDIAYCPISRGFKSLVGFVSVGGNTIKCYITSKPSYRLCPQNNHVYVLLKSACNVWHCYTPHRLSVVIL